MSIHIAPEPAKPDITMFETLANCFRRYIADTPDVYVMDADLGINRLITPAFLEKHPNRFVNVGIAESNMVGVACGLSVHGKRPFVHTFACLASRRAMDQVFLSGAFNRASVKIIGTFPGVCADINGGTHVAFEDVAMMRAIPEMIVLEPSDCVQGEDILNQLSTMDGMAFVRWDRVGNVRFYEPGSRFEIGKAVRLRDGKDVTLCVAGSVCMEQAMIASARLVDEGLSVRILDMYSLKPLDEAAVREAIDETGALVTVENHNVINGLGAAVASVMAGHAYAPIEMVGIRDEFGEVGKTAELVERFGLDAKTIAAAARKAVSRKQ